MKKQYTGEKSDKMAVILENELKVHSNYSKGWYVKFDKTPANVRSSFTAIIVIQFSFACRFKKGKLTFLK